MFRSFGLGRAWAADERGGVAITFGLSALVLIAVAGGAVDFGRVYSAKGKMQSAVDSATLAAASTYALDPQHSVSNAVAKGRSHFMAMMAGTPGVSFTSSIDPSTQTVSSTAQTIVDTSLLSVVGIPSMTLTAYAEATTQSSLANGDVQVEMALMLDLTGSMSESAGNGKSKIAALRDAAKELVDIMLPDSAQPHARMALAPFAPTVNAGDDLIEAVTGLPLTKTTCTQTDDVCINTTCAKYNKDGSCKTWNQSCTKECKKQTTTYLNRCVVERSGTEQYTDMTPSPGAYVPVFTAGGDGYASSLAKARDCTPSESVVPLTSNKGRLKSTIAKFDASGTTAGALGTAWAWYLLSPNWSGVLSDGAPQPYGSSKLKKIAVLMTDGTYNTEFGNWYGDGSSDAKRISANAVKLCGGMKAAGIEVYTVGFKLDNKLAKDTLAECATDKAHAFLAEDGDQLAQVFREVAYRSVPLHLSR